jgi:hypothetical protein
MHINICVYIHTHTQIYTITSDWQFWHKYLLYLLNNLHRLFHKTIRTTTSTILPSHNSSRQSQLLHPPLCSHTTPANHHNHWIHRSVFTQLQQTITTITSTVLPSHNSSKPSHPLHPPLCSHTTPTKHQNYYIHSFALIQLQQTITTITCTVLPSQNYSKQS